MVMVIWLGEAKRTLCNVSTGFFLISSVKPKDLSSLL